MIEGWEREPAGEQGGVDRSLCGLRVAGVPGAAGAVAGEADSGHSDGLRHELHGRAGVLHLQPAR